MVEAEENEIELRVRNAVARALSLSEEEARADLRMGSHPHWDSLGHMGLVMEVEKEFGIVFPARTIALLTSIDAIVEAVRRERR